MIVEVASQRATERGIIFLWILQKLFKRRRRVEAGPEIRAVNYTIGAEGRSRVRSIPSALAASFAALFPTLLLSFVLSVTWPELSACKPGAVRLADAVDAHRDKGLRNAGFTGGEYLGKIGRFLPGTTCSLDYDQTAGSLCR